MEDNYISSLFFFVSLVVFVQICLVEFYYIGPSSDFVRPSLPPEEKHNIMMEESINIKDEMDGIVDEGDTLRSLDEILHQAGVEVTDELLQQLPPKEDVKSMYGSKPIIIGLDQCKKFRDTVDSGDAFIAPAGMFNTVSFSSVPILSS